MKIQIPKNKLIAIMFIFLLSSCGNEQKNDFDLSDLKLKRPVKELSNEEEISNKEKKESVIYELKQLKNKEEILSSTKFGKVDPFSSAKTSLTLSKIRLKGFITIKEKNFAIVNYLDKEGAVNLGTIGGINSDLLPEGALIKEINPEKNSIKIFHEDENFILSTSNY